MSDWPAGLAVGPLGDWPGGLTPAHKRQRSQFSAGWLSTTRMLRSELQHLRAKNPELLVAIDAQQFRLDGYPRAQAKAEHPGIIVSFDSEFGHMSYPCDTFTTWQDNLRAVALALEALRKVDRYGVTAHGEQYRGFLAIEATALPADPFTDAASASDWILRITGWDAQGYSLPRIEARRGALSKAKRETHPDRGGDAEDFRLVMRAEQLLRDAGLI